jgi:hypothetical protein
MISLADQLAAFAKSHGGTVRTGPQPQKPLREIPPSIGPFENERSPSRGKADPFINYSDDYTVWKQGR